MSGGGGASSSREKEGGSSNVLGRVKHYVRKSKGSSIISHPSSSYSSPAHAKTTTTTPTPFTFVGYDALPPEVVVEVLRWVHGPRELAAAGATCRTWYAASLEPALWRKLYFEAKRAKRLERLRPIGGEDGECQHCDAAALVDMAVGMEEIDEHRRGADDALIDWRARYKATYHVSRSERKDNLMVFLDCSQFTGSGVMEPAVSGEVVLNVASRRIVTHGVYVVVTGKEVHTYGAGRYQRTLRNNILSLAVGLSDEVPWSHRHERRIVYEHGTHRLPFRFTARGSMIPPSFRRVAYQLMYSVSYKLRAVIACPRFHPDLWTPKRAHPLTVLPCPRFQQVQHKMHQNMPRRTVVTFLNGLIRITISLPKTGFYLGEPIQMQVEVENHSPVDFHFLAISAVEQMRSPFLRDTWVDVFLTRQDRKQRLKDLALRSKAAQEASSMTRNLTATGGGHDKRPEAPTKEEGEYDDDDEEEDDDEDEAEDSHREGADAPIGDLTDENEDGATREETERRKRTDGQSPRLEGRGDKEEEEEEEAREDAMPEEKGKKKDKAKEKKKAKDKTKDKERGEKLFPAEIPKGQRSVHNVDVVIDEEDTNGNPLCVPSSAFVWQRYVLNVKLRRKEGRSLILSALEPSADSAAIVFLARTPPPHMHRHHNHRSRSRSAPHAPSGSSCSKTCSHPRGC